MVWVVELGSEGSWDGSKVEIRWHQRWRGDNKFGRLVEFFFLAQKFILVTNF